MVIERYYKPELDVLRLFAFLCVFLTHRMDLAPIDPAKYYWSYHIRLVGVFGVPFFFLLSAFLITELLTREQALHGKIQVRAFYMRRILRIWPLYFIVFFGLVLLTFVFDNFGNIPPAAWVAFSLFSGNWYITFNEWIQAYPVNPLWSISVEEQFYIIIPLLIFYFGHRWLKAISFMFFGIAYLTVMYYARNPVSGFSGEWTNSFVQFQFFAAGMLLSLYLRGWKPRWPVVARFFILAAALGCWLTASIIYGIHADAPHLSTIPQALFGWLLVLVGVVLFFLAFYGLPARYLSKPVVFLGRISYGLYVFHALMFFLVYEIYKDDIGAFSNMFGLYDWRNSVGATIAFILTVCISILSYRFFERPFLRLKKRFTFIPSRD